MLAEFRCKRCNKLLGKHLGGKQLEIKCPRCGLINNVNRKFPILAP
ncbi:MAG: Com family DNA-binding transcriptional regulator [Syntrophomonadaceae bacterium]|jgi:phage FluMu protein Com